MDWMNQNKFSKLLVGVLLLVNIMAIVIIWVLVSGEQSLPPFSKDKPPFSPVEMMRRELELSDNQTKEFDAMFKAHRKETGEVFAQMNKLREELSLNLFIGEENKARTDSILNEIGQLQTKSERLRYNHFIEFISICTPEQKEKLKPMLKKILSGKPPHENPEKKPGLNEKKDFPGKPPE
jgi:Spy/CpxP family protein refolding chaperone